MKQLQFIASLQLVESALQVFVQIMFLKRSKNNLRLKLKETQEITRFVKK